MRTIFIFYNNQAKKRIKAENITAAKGIFHARKPDAYAAEADASADAKTVSKAVYPMPHGTSPTAAFENTSHNSSIYSHGTDKNDENGSPRSGGSDIRNTAGKINPKRGMATILTIRPAAGT